MRRKYLQSLLGELLCGPPEQHMQYVVCQFPRCRHAYAAFAPFTLAVSCTVFDPRCTVCNAVECLACADPLLKSIRRSGQRRQDAKLPFDELRRETSDTNPHMTQSRFAFDEGEMFFLTSDVPGLRGAGYTPSTAATTQERHDYMPPARAPPANGDAASVDLADVAVQCHQAWVERDATWTCFKWPVSERVCGHPGLFAFSSPTYSVWEDSTDLRITVVRTGGGLGRATVKYNLMHNTTNSSDVTPTVHYTSTQACRVE